MLLKVKENASGTTHIEVKTYYSKGGYHAYKPEARGYYVSATPQRRVNHDGYTMVETVCFTGYRKLIKEVSRLSQKTLAQLDEKTLENASDILMAVLEKNGLELEEEVTAA